ncbi:DUF421 domain-containing protein [Jeotgalibacillus campisalis]|uniref:YetF C-terminal domain-containing protein n=1 Tax=Jeotgalibacillus campisalis TaxID=220754 RepID=A0A0C2VDX2_9BACL|nr:DUF421 domain-containing protein [Jeotgalibacillus campisalis]KIL47122.1 hypothetical protein KR50_24440 [Jeotgalibacillus campisalis]
MPDWLIVLGRGLAMLMVLFFMTKVLGKKQISQLSFFEYVIGITAGSIGAEVITGLDRNFFHGIIGISSFIAIPFLVDKLSMKNKKLRDFFEGKGTVVIQNGNIIEKSLNKEKYTIDELMELLRKKDVFDVSNVEFAILEPTGDLNVLLKKEKRPLTSEDIGLVTDEEKEPCTIIMDGAVMIKTLASIGKDEQWLEEQLAKKNKRVEDVFLAQVNSVGQLYLDLYDDNASKAQTDQGKVIKAIMERCKADLDLLSLESTDEESKLMYQKNSDKLQTVLHDLKTLSKPI